MFFMCSQYKPSTPIKQRFVGRVPGFLSLKRCARYDRRRCALAGDMQRAAQERAVLDGFAPDFIASLFRGENRVFTRPEDMEHLLDGLRLTMGEGS